MRISTNTIYQSGINKISSLQADQARLQQQISSGKRILTPSDDPLAASDALVISQAKSINTQYNDNRKSAELKLSGLESSLSSITDLITATQSTVIGAGNATLSDTERGFIASELKGKLEALIGLANTQDASGNYIYAGFNSASPAFTATATGATYNGDTNQQLLQVDGQRQMATSVTGDSVFQANGVDLFSTFKNLITSLTPPTSAASLPAALATGIGNLKATADNVLTIRASVGTSLNEIDALNTAASSRDLQYSQTLSGLQDLDYAKALSDVTQKQTILNAAQKSFVTTSGLSLFDYIK